MIKFGPSGNCESFYANGHKSTMESPAWVKAHGLDIFEYSFGKGYMLSSETAKAIGNKFKDFGIELSLHAPYFINFANPSEEMYEKTKGYIRNGIKYLRLMNAKRLIFHPGSCGKAERDDAFALTKQRLKELMDELEKEGLLEGIWICPETMGKMMQLGTVEEILELCELNDHLIPAFDFGHINSRTGGTLKTKDDFKAIFEESIAKIGFERTKNCHIHFSKIEYGGKGEIRHLNFDDTVYGPNFEPLAQCLVEMGLTPNIICESAGMQTEDAVQMKNFYENARQK